MKTAAVISYCSYQKDFIRELVKQARKFVTGEIVVVSFDHYFDGMKEEVTHIPFSTYKAFHLQLRWDKDKDPKYHHNLQRLGGYKILKEDYDGVYFFDGDEVPDGELMKQWQDSAEIGNYRFASNWYFRDTCYTAKILRDSAAFVSTNTLESSDCNWFGPSERENFAPYDSWRRLTVSSNDKALVDHYGWVGTKQMLLRKCRSWAHNTDRDWIAEVEYEFSHEFDYRCFFSSEDRFIKVPSKLDFTYNE